MTPLFTSGRRFATLALTTAAVTTVATLAGTSANAAPAVGQIRYAGGNTAVSNSYIVVFKDAKVTRPAVAQTARDLATRHGGSVARTYQAALRGFEARVSAKQAARIAADPSVAYVEQTHTVQIQDTQTNPPSWGLDRIDQRNLPLDNSYTYPSTAPTVHAYIIDTGIRFSHSTFGGRATSGFDAVDGGSADDCNGHGTHVSGTVGGSEYGVAKGVALVGVRVLDCDGSGTTAGVAAGVDWVTANAIKPAVANMSLGGGADTVLDSAVTNSINSGVTYGIAAGNGNALGIRQNACNFSPARVPTAITVGATQTNDAAASFSNFGTCVDILAPGVGITSSWLTDDTATNTISGTSMATPHVVGAAALVLAANPDWTPQQVRDELVNTATPNVITNVGTGTPNQLLFVGNTAPADNFSLALTPASGSVVAGSSATSAVSTETTAGVDQTVNLTASGLPSGVTASFSPSSVASGGSSTLTLDTTSSAPNGTFPVTVTGTGTSTAHTATFSLTITGGVGGICTGTNGTDVQIPDAGAAVFSDIPLPSCGRAASGTSTVAVQIVHTWRGDLVVDLVAPDGSTYRLKNSSPTDSADDVNTTFTANLSTESGTGTWRLRVQDVFSLDTGFINSWTLTL